MQPYFNLSQYQHRVSKLQPLTESEAKLDHFINEHFDQLSYYGIIDVAQKAKISKATIGRYLTRLGFSGYSEFKQALAQQAHDHTMIAPIEAQKSQCENTAEDNAHAAQTYLGNIEQLIQDFSQHINIKDINTLVDLLLDKTRKIYVVGPASSSALAIHFSSLLKYSRSDITLLSLDKSELPKALLGLSSQDVLVVFSYYRFNPMVVDICHFFYSKQAQVSVITNTHSHPYGKYCDISFVLPSDADSIFHSRAIAFIFIEMLLYLVQKNSKDDGNFEELEQMFQFFNTFSALGFNTNQSK